MRNIRIAERSEVPARPPRPRTVWDRARDWAATVPLLALPLVLLWALLQTSAVSPRLEVVPSLAAPGTSVAVQGSGLDAGERGLLTWDGAPIDGGGYRATGHGRFTVVIVVPPDAALGPHEISAVTLSRGKGQANGKRPKPEPKSAASVRATAELVVVAPEESASPSTGVPSQPPTDATPRPTATPTPSPATPTPSTTPTALPSQSSAPTPTPEPIATPVPPTSCPASLQRLVDQATAGSTVTVGPCIFRETVNIGKPLTVITVGGKVDGEGSRTHAFVVSADDVTIDGFEITRTTNPAQDGAVRVRNASRFKLRNAHIHHTGGACISIAGGSGHRVLNSELAYCEQEGFHLPSITDSVIARNRIHHNNPNNRYSSGWEAGAGKLSSGAKRVTFENNEVYANVGWGLWADYVDGGIVFRGNRIHHNTRGGIHFEISTGALIEGNAVWENGWGHTTWGWGAGIVISSSRNVEVRDNVVAWNGDGIAVVSQNRGGAANTVANVHVHHNAVAIAPQPSDSSASSLLAWQEDWNGVMHNSASNNRGGLNRYWHPNPEPGSRFEWDGTIGRLTTFNATPGEEGGAYLTLSARDAVLSAAGIPLRPITR